MSLIGPRPLVEGELLSHDGLTLYNKVKPGITGWWACNGRSNISYRERLELEYYYVKNCTLYLDILCIVRTISVIQIQVATDPGFNDIIKTATAGKKKTSKKIKGLTSKQTYYVRIRAYSNLADGKHVSVWKTKKVKIK